jgi:hypothetical protein
MPGALATRAGDPEDGRRERNSSREMISAAAELRMSRFISALADTINLFLRTNCQAYETAHDS